MRFSLAVLIGRLIRGLIRIVRRGGGSALPGLVVSKIAPNLLASVLNSFVDGVLVITGSAGKSSTTKMVVAIARAHGKRVFTNPTTANIRQGFFASILEECDWRGRIEGDVAILEVDEGHASDVLRATSARFVTVLNVTDDQLDRFIDPELVRKKLLAVALQASEGVVLNADDQNLLILAKDGENSLKSTSYFGFKSELIKSRYMGFANTYLPTLPKPKLSLQISSVVDQTITAESLGQTVVFKLPNRGIHYAADAAAALETSRVFLANDFDLKMAAETIESLPPVFARGEITRIQGVEVELVLVQNPASFQLNLDAFESRLENVMVAIGRDVHDPSWLWTVDYSNLARVSVVTGYNAFEMALCLAYKDIKIDFVSEDLEASLGRFLSGASKVRPVVFLSADAMRRYRRMLGFVSPEMVGLS